MTQSSNRIFDELARLATDAAGAAQGVRREIETVVRSQFERLIKDKLGQQPGAPAPASA